MRARTQAIGLFVTAIVASCRQVVGVGDPAPPPSCPLPSFASAACSDCMIDRCCSELARCDADSSCRLLRDCTQRCADDGCRRRCEGEQPLTEAAADLLACQMSSCESACGVSCGAMGAPLTECLPCALSCCAEGTTFRGERDGQRLRACRAHCLEDDIACRERCANDHAAGAHLERATYECIARACEIAGDWSCIGKVERLRGKMETIDVVVDAYDIVTLTPVSGATVKGCAPTDTACIAPAFGTTTTDANGLARISVPLRPGNGFDAYPGPIEIARDDYLVGLVYFAPAVTASGRFRAFMSTRALASEVEAASGVVRSADRGSVAIGALDCSAVPRAGVSFSASTADGSSRPFYLGALSAGQPLYDFAAKATGDVGYGVVFNLPAGPSKLTMRIDALCTDAGSIDVGIRADALTFVAMRPLR